MAKKEELKYLQVPLPQGERSYEIIKTSWQGLNRRETMDSGVLSDESNISTDASPYLIPSQKRATVNDALDYYTSPISMFGFDDFLVVVYKEADNSIKIDYLKGETVYTGTIFSHMAIAGTALTIASIHSHKHLIFNSDTEITITLPLLSTKYRFSFENQGLGSVILNTQTGEKIITSSGEAETALYESDYNKIDVECGTDWYIINTGITTDEYLAQPRSIVKFNVYSDTTDPVGGDFIEKLLIFPDRKSMDFNISASFTPADMDGVPRMNYVTVHNSRLFGVDNDRIYASGFNDYTNWTLDTADTMSANNAWLSPAQANTKANGKFKAIIAFAGHIICFKDDYMHELYNNKNPFRIQDIYAEGTIDNRSIAEADGQLIYADNDDIKIYTGSNPKRIGRPLNIDKFEKAIAGSDGRKYYLYCEDTDSNKYMFTYDTLVGQWAQESMTYEVLAFAHNLNGMYMLSAGGAIYKLDTNDYDGQNWWFGTDLHLNRTIDIKRIRKIQLLADIGAGSTIEIYQILNDDVGATESDLIYSQTNTGSSTVRLPIRTKPKKTASYGYKLQIRGTSYVKLYQLEISVNKGGELFGY